MMTHWDSKTSKISRKIVTNVAKKWGGLGRGLNRGTMVQNSLTLGHLIIHGASEQMSSAEYASEVNRVEQANGMILTSGVLDA